MSTPEPISDERLAVLEASTGHVVMIDAVKAIISRLRIAEQARAAVVADNAALWDAIQSVPCDCGPEYLDRGLVAPDCRKHHGAEDYLPDDVSHPGTALLEERDKLKDENAELLERVAKLESELKAGRK